MPQAQDPGGLPTHPQHTHSLPLFCALAVGGEEGSAVGQPAQELAPVIQLCPALNEWEDIFRLRHVWPLAPQRSVAGR